jgi:hypothetical protein
MVHVESARQICQGSALGMSAHTGLEFHLSMFVQDAETSLAIKKQIGEYLGFPTGEQLGLLHRATKNMNWLPPLRDLYE